MAKPTDYTSYPAVYFTIIQQVATTGRYETSGTREDCHALRFDLYGFKRALNRANHPDAIIARQISWYLTEEPDGSAKLIGLRKDHGKLTRMAEAGLLRHHDPLFGPTSRDLKSLHEPIEAPTMPRIETLSEEDAIRKAREKMGLPEPTEEQKSRTSDELLQSLMNFNLPKKDDSK